MEQTFLNISRQECLRAYEPMLQNAEMHFRIAKIIADEKEYGPAISHLVLGSEETVKALIIFLDGIGMHIREIKGIKRLFTQHTKRHELSGIFLMMSYVITPCWELLERLRVLIHDLDARKSMSDFERALLTVDKKSTESMSASIVDFFTSKIENKIESHYNFWQDAEKSKQKGFYADYENSLLLPANVLENDYLKAFEICSNYSDFIFKVISNLKVLKNSEAKEFASFINKKTNFYQKLEGFINPERDSLEGTCQVEV